MTNDSWLDSGLMRKHAICEAGSNPATHVAENIVTRDGL